MKTIILTKHEMDKAVGGFSWGITKLKIKALVAAAEELWDKLNDNTLS